MVTDYDSRPQAGSYNFPGVCSCNSVIHATRAVHVAVGIFLFAGVPDSTDFHVEGQRLASQWMVGIDIYIKSPDLNDGDFDRPLPGLQTNNLTGLQLFWKADYSSASLRAGASAETVMVILSDMTGGSCGVCE